MEAKIIYEYSLLCFNETYEGYFSKHKIFMKEKVPFRVIFFIYFGYCCLACQVFVQEGHERNQSSFMNIPYCVLTKLMKVIFPNTKYL